MEELRKGFQIWKRLEKDIFNKYLGAKWDWKERNIFNLESTSVGATTWVHYDVKSLILVIWKISFC